MTGSHRVPRALTTTGTIVDATLIHAPSSTKNREQSRDPESGVIFDQVPPQARTRHSALPEIFNQPDIVSKLPFIRIK